MPHTNVSFIYLANTDDNSFLMIGFTIVSPTD